MKIAARFILSLVLFSILYSLFSIPVSASATFDVAQSQNPPNPYLNPNTNPDVPKNLHTWTQTVMIEVMSAMSCQLTGIDPTDPKSKCLGIDPKSGNIGFVEGGGGAIGMAGKMIAMLYTPPLHTSDYFRYLASNFGIAKPAQAAGFEGLKPIQSLWIAFRNVVYLLFVIIFIVIGLAIMLRVRIDPRTVMTIQNQIPKIIIGLLLLTFSFAIAGFLIDLMYVVIFLSYEVISGSGITKPDGKLVDFGPLNPINLQNATPFTASDGIASLGVFGIAANATASIFFLVNALFKDLIEELLTGGQSGIPLIGGLFDWINALIVKGIAFIVGGLVGGVASIIAFLIIATALLFALIRLWFVLIMAYVSILLNIVLAPFWIAASLLPGGPIGFTAWLRNMIANLAAFPAVIIMFLLAKAFIEGFGANPSATAFIPPLIGDITGTDRIGALIGIGIIFMTDDVVRMLRAALKAPTTPLGAIGAAVGAGSGVTFAIPKILLGGVTGGLAYAFGQKFAQRIPFLRTGTPGAGGPAQCLPGNSLISTPAGFLLIKDLRVGDFVWTIDRFGSRVKTIIVKKAKRIVSKSHKMAHVILKDSRELIVSPGHPTIDYREIGSLVRGEDIDMSSITSIKIIAYKDKYTYDILPYSVTGGYFANNILIGSTLSDQFQKKKHHKTPMQFLSKLYALSH